MASYILATYEYDAWGNHRVLDINGFENTNSTFIGNINPFRYRGYYYDVETGFYYLQTRYYDPTICRFINADNYELIAQLSSTYELNLFTYCGNNPIMRVDETGEGLLTMMIIGAIVSGVISASVDIISQVDENGWASINWLQVGTSFLGGALSGAVAASPLGLGWQIGINAGINMLQNVAAQTYSGQKFNFLELLYSGVTGAYAGVAGGVGLWYVNKDLKIQLGNYTANRTFRVLSISLNSAILKGGFVNIIFSKIYSFIKGW